MGAASYSPKYPQGQISRILSRFIPLSLLGQLAEQEGVTLELCLYGGSAMMLAYGARAIITELFPQDGKTS